MSGWVAGGAVWGRYLDTLMLGKGSLPANSGMTSIWTLCVAMAATGIDTNPELFPHTAQLLLLSTTETNTQSVKYCETQRHEWNSVQWNSSNKMKTSGDNKPATVTRYQNVLFHSICTELTHTPGHVFWKLIWKNYSFSSICLRWKNEVFINLMYVICHLPKLRWYLNDTFVPRPNVVWVSYPHTWVWLCRGLCSLWPPPPPLSLPHWAPSDAWLKPLTDRGTQYGIAVPPLQAGSLPSRYTRSVVNLRKRDFLQSYSYRFSKHCLTILWNMTFIIVLSALKHWMYCYNESIISLLQYGWKCLINVITNF